MQPAKIDRRLAALEAQAELDRRRRLRAWFDRIEQILGTDYDRWLEMSLFLTRLPPPRIVPPDMRDEWRRYEDAVAADPVVTAMRVQLVGISSGEWIEIDCGCDHADDDEATNNPT